MTTFREDIFVKCVVVNGSLLRYHASRPILGEIHGGGWESIDLVVRAVSEAVGEPR